jgi:hypothetical protein
VYAVDETAPPPLENSGIKFANKVQKNSIDPVDIVKSITMLEKSHKEIKTSEAIAGEKESIEPMLVISSHDSSDTDIESIPSEFSDTYRRVYSDSEKLKNKSKATPNNKL